jgi:hypothetical protein
MATLQGLSIPQAVRLPFTSARTNIIWVIALCLLAGCQKERSVDDFPETIYPETPTMRSAYDAMETK